METKNFGEDFLKKLKKTMAVEDPHANLPQWERYKKAVNIATDFAKRGKFGAFANDIKEKLNWHTIKIYINFDDDLDGPEETKEFSEFLSLFDYVVFEQGEDGIILNCSIENIYV